MICGSCRIFRKNIKSVSQFLSIAINPNIWNIYFCCVKCYSQLCGYITFDILMLLFIFCFLFLFFVFLLLLFWNKISLWGSRLASKIRSSHVSLTNARIRGMTFCTWFTFSFVRPFQFFLFPLILSITATLVMSKY